MRMSGWSADVCSSDLVIEHLLAEARTDPAVDPAGRGEFDHVGAAPDLEQSGRASCRERVCQYVYISVVAVSFQKKHDATQSIAAALDEHLPTPTGLRTHPTR